MPVGGNQGGVFSGPSVGSGASLGAAPPAPAGVVGSGANAHSMPWPWMLAACSLAHTEDPLHAAVLQAVG